MKAQHSTAFMLREGKTIPLDYPSALNWYQKAAFQGHAESQFSLGYMLLKGIGTEKDTASAIYWYEKAADQEHNRAKQSLLILRLSKTSPK